jgi:hypothetical protein
MKKLLIASALIFLPLSAHAATALQWGVDRTTTPWTTCVYDANNVCQAVFTVPATGGGALTPPSTGGTGVSNSNFYTITLGGAVSTSGPFTLSGSFAFTGTLTAATTVTFPSSGTLATTTTPAASVIIGTTVITGGTPGNIETNVAGKLGETSAVAVTQGGTGQNNFTSNLPLLGNGASSLTQGTSSGNTTKFATVSGSPVSGHCASWDVNGNAVDAGGACTTGGGGGTVTAGTANNLGYYATSSSVISSLPTANNGVLVTSGAGVPSISTTLPNMALGTPTSATLTNATGLPVSTGVSGLGTGVATGLANAATGSGSPVLATSPALTTPNIGTPSAGVATNLSGLPLTTGVTGQLPLANGGMNASLTASNGGIFYSTGSAGAILAGTATANQCLLSGSSAAPTWGACGSVTSFNSRTGAVSPASGDYTTGQLTTATSGSSPASGKLGETITNLNGGPTSLVNSTSVTLATVSLTAGDWVCNGISTWNISNSVTYTQENIGITATPSSIPIFPASTTSVHASITTTVVITFPERPPTVIFRPTTTTSYYLVGNLDFTGGGSANANGYLQCVRQD